MFSLLRQPYQRWYSDTGDLLANIKAPPTCARDSDLAYWYVDHALQLPKPLVIMAFLSKLHCLAAAAVHLSNRQGQTSLVMMLHGSE